MRWGTRKNDSTNRIACPWLIYDVSTRSGCGDRPARSC